MLYALCFRLGQLLKDTRDHTFVPLVLRYIVIHVKPIYLCNPCIIIVCALV
jgi:hypothetical protein